jgi:hypothetical protein
VCPKKGALLNLCFQGLRQPSLRCSEITPKIDLSLPHGGFPAVPFRCPKSIHQGPRKCVNLLGASFDLEGNSPIGFGGFRLQHVCRSLRSVKGLPLSAICNFLNLAKLQHFLPAPFNPHARLYAQSKPGYDLLLPNCGNLPCAQRQDRIQETEVGVEFRILSVQKRPRALLPMSMF